MRTRAEWVFRNVGWRLPGRGTVYDEHFRGEIELDVLERPMVAGAVIDDWQMQDLMMCPSGGSGTAKRARVGFQLRGAHPSLIRSGWYNEVEIRRDSQGYFLWIELVMFDPGAPQGFGPCALLRAAQASQRLGLLRIDLVAAGGRSWDPGFNGYYSWPRFGFNCTLEAGMLEKVRTVPHLSECDDLLDVMDRDREWWRKHGDGCLMSFDLAEGSRSWHTLLAYLKARGLLK